ncbi:MAG: hypothetical protein II532_02505, partial [Bacteroidales bacterium]|nr:hypothetical protein [Bacteroidales bacterium]
NVFGSGDNGHVLHNTQVVVYNGTIGGTGNGGPTTGNVFGSGRGSDTYLNGSSEPTLSANAGRVYGNTDVYIVGGTLKNNVYGGGYLATVDGNTNVTVATSATLTREGWTYTGLVPTPDPQSVTFPPTPGNPLVYGDVFGASALGEMGAVNCTTTVNILGGTIGSGSSYKYSDLGCGNIFGGGNGDAEGIAMNSYSNGTTAGHRDANVLNVVQVNIGEPSQYNDNSKGAVINGSVFGGNNIAGSPKNDIYVDVYSTAHTDANAYSAVKGFATPVDKVDTNDLSVVEGYDDSRFALAAVYGGGNKAAVIPTAISGTTTTVVIHECNENTIKYVYGGGNAADLGNNTHTMSTNVTIEGGHIYQAFAGGNGAGVGNPGANVFGDASILVTGGAVNQVFGGSNSLGDITGISSLTFDGVNDENCDQVNIDAFGGGNRATNSGNIEVTILCSSKGLNNVYGAGNAADFDGDITVNVLGGQMKNLYGGARAANIHGNVTVNVFSGEIGSVFGGNNESGYIFGTNMDGTPNLNKGNIEVNIDIEEQRCTYPNKIGYVYGGGNMAAYKPELTTTWSTDVDGSFVLGSPTFSYNASRLSPVVNIISGQVDTAVFGGGWGTTATVIANPKVVVGAERVQQWNDVLNTIEPVTPPVPNNMVNIGSATHNEGTRIWGNVFGGGNAAPVEGNTSVYIIGNADVKNNVYGGGNAATVNGSTHVTIGETTCE